MKIKLVRDNIPEIITSKGEIADYYIADEAEYKTRLNDKLLEEVAELLKADNEQDFKEEIADVLEVIDAIVNVNNIDITELMQIKEAKKQKRGAFIKRYILKM